MASGERKRLQEDEEELGGPKFSPPLYQQRYLTVLEVVRRLQSKKVVDVGCAECKLLWQLKREPCIEELVGVDVDGLLLNMHQGVVHPLTTDYLHPRDRPLHFTLMHGSIAEPDVRLINFDLLLCIEVIEHLDPPTLDSVPESIFGILSPKVVVMTTPNSEFNVLFPGFSGFRHPDHRFEWSRDQFQSWCNKIAGCYGYNVEYTGIGIPPPGREDVGCCSQMATFTQCEAHIHCRRNCDVTPSAPYTIVAEAIHPHRTNPLSPEQELCSEVEYYLGVLLRQSAEDQGHPDRGEFVYINLTDVLQFPKVRDRCTSLSSIQCSLKHSLSIQLDTTGTYAVFPRDPQNSQLSSSDSELEEVSCLNTIHTIQTDYDKITEEDWEND